MTGAFSLSSSEPVNRSWPSINRANDRADSAHRRHAGIIQATSEVRRRPTLATNGNFPFRIYQPHPCQLPLGFDMTTAWRTFLVRSGQVNGVPLTGPGCDGYDTNPDDDLYPLDDTDDTGAAVQPITIPLPTTGAYFFWIDKTVIPTSNPDGNPILGSGYLSQLPTSWAFPQPDGLHWLIGSVTLTAADATAGVNQAAVIRQSLRADIWDTASSGGIYIVNDNALHSTLVEGGDWVSLLLNGNSITIAKPTNLQLKIYNNHTSENGGIWTAGPNFSTRYETVNGVKFTQFVRPTYSDPTRLRLFITKPVGGTGVVDAAGAPVQWQDLNVDARKWETMMSDCYNGSDIFWRLCCEPYMPAQPAK